MAVWVDTCWKNIHLPVDFFFLHRWTFNGQLWLVRLPLREPSRCFTLNMLKSFWSPTARTAANGSSTRVAAATWGRSVIGDKCNLVHNLRLNQSVKIVNVYQQVFTGNKEAYETKHNTFFPPMIGRFIRLYPIEWYGKATVRMEFYGCELDGMLCRCMVVFLLCPVYPLTNPNFLQFLDVWYISNPTPQGAQFL